MKYEKPRRGRVSTLGGRPMLLLYVLLLSLIGVVGLRQLAVVHAGPVPPILTITADNQTNVYGAALPTLTVSYSGFVNGDTSASLTTQPTVSTAANASSPVSGSPYAITASGASDPNYTIVYVDGSLTVTAALLTITADNQTKVYGAALPTLTASYTGFVNGDTSASLATPPTLSTIATAGSHVSGSPYAITASGAADSDYAISYVAGILIIT
ncbi:MAG: Cadherin-like beta sandwich protein, partial [Chloroflexi bacterium]|nr:Cadherin-like beta sandwich protein [Chloroflexota bacterium]